MIITGDLTEQAAQRWPGAIKWLDMHFPTAKTVVLPGNHDYCGGNLDSCDADLDRICREAGCSVGQENEFRSADIGDRVRLGLIDL